MLRLLTIKFEERTETFNDAILTNFLSDKKIIKWESNFFEKKGSQYWAVLLEYEPVVQSDEKMSSNPEQMKKRDIFSRIIIRVKVGCGSNRVIRGGSWNNTAANCRASYRNGNHPANRWHNNGLRLASSL